MKRGDRLGIRDIMMGANYGHSAGASSFIIVGHSRSLTLPTTHMGMYKSLPQVHQNHYFLLWDSEYCAIVFVECLVSSNPNCTLNISSAVFSFIEIDFVDLHSAISGCVSQFFLPI